jgi:hypothetical protein
MVSDCHRERLASNYFLEGVSEGRWRNSPSNKFRIETSRVNTFKETKMLTAKLIYKIDGREVSQEKYASHMKNQMLVSIKDAMRAKIEAVRCPVHNKTGKAILVEDTGANFKFGIDGCCESLSEAVQAAISNEQRHPNPSSV